ncbi:aminoacyl-tRNA hydrolase [Marinagarivorans algicola]|uniref:aminoacyl-tRNA hydrolase n=1 Tax=Marinagarivorans algicola TaxID=1513270 RepID=UPI0006B49AA2|nr:aminoacyl-tRNA hydrolase [Marinagarivorans algicola]
MKAPVQLIVGLGNPGSQYQHTRHNAGEDFVTELCHKYGGTLTSTPKFFGHSARINIHNRDIRLLVPTTYMNLSGKAVGAMCQFYKIPAEAILVAHDELDLAPGIAKLKVGGGHGGHNGLRDMISALGNNKDFARLRLGIGHPGHAKLVADFVLKKAPQQEFALTQDAIGHALNVMPDIAAGHWEKAMKELHTQAK